MIGKIWAYWGCNSKALQGEGGNMSSVMNGFVHTGARPEEEQGLERTPGRGSFGWKKWLKLPGYAPQHAKVVLLQGKFTLLAVRIQQASLSRKNLP
jgi:hypothetical protein